MDSLARATAAVAGLTALGLGMATPAFAAPTVPDLGGLGSGGNVPGLNEAVDAVAGIPSLLAPVTNLVTQLPGLFTFAVPTAAPSLPSVPSTPSLSSLPTLPTLPSEPTLPTLPAGASVPGDVPGLSSLSSLPAAGLPSAASLPSVPTAASLPTTPTLPTATLPSVPTANATPELPAVGSALQGLDAAGLFGAA